MRLKLYLALALLLASGSPLMSQGADLQAIIRDTQRMVKTGNHITMVWWIPYYYWEASFDSSTKIAPEARKQVLEMLSHYNIVSLADVNFDALGALHSKTEADLAANTVLQLDGHPVAMLAVADLPDGMKNLLAIVRPILGNALGTFGKDMVLQIYPGSKDANETNWEKREGKLAVRVYDQNFLWRLPLPSTLPPRHNPKTGDEYPGDYKFDPYTGDRLN
jgi:hypothetical protein